jgi:hypothetical protein
MSRCGAVLTAPYCQQKDTACKKRYIAQCDVLKYKQRREGRRWQDMANVCTFCPRGLSWAFPAKLNAPPHAKAIASNRCLARVCACNLFFWQRENALVPRPAKNLKLEERIEVGRGASRRARARRSWRRRSVSLSRHVNRLAKEEAGEGIAARDPSETVAFRASQSELAAFDAEWRERGFSNRSQALNAVLRGDGAVFPRCAP